MALFLISVDTIIASKRAGLRNLRLFYYNVYAALNLCEKLWSVINESLVNGVMD